MLDPVDSLELDDIEKRWSEAYAGGAFSGSVLIGQNAAELIEFDVPRLIKEDRELREDNAKLKDELRTSMDAGAISQTGISELERVAATQRNVILRLEQKANTLHTEAAAMRERLILAVNSSEDDISEMDVTGEGMPELKAVLEKSLPSPATQAENWPNGSRS
jgi:hypothetical protein